LTDATLCNYLQSAVAWLQQLRPGLALPIYSQSGTGKADRLHPYLADILANRRLWKKPRPLKEPLSSEMLHTMARMADSYREKGTYGNYGRNPVLWDFACLACYTGSRIGEYGYSRRPRGMPVDGFVPIPRNADVPSEWQGRPMAFIAEDFTFFDSRRRRLKHSKVLRAPRAVSFVRIRFRYDKSPTNFAFRTFARVQSFFCIVTACISIIERYRNDPRRRDNEPLGYFLGENGRRYAIGSHHVKAYLAEVCELAHPNARHYLREHCDLLMSHSFRVTAAVILFNAGVPIDDIAYRLRWHSDSVKKYLRDCARTINDLSLRAMDGAYQSVESPTP